jgi:quinoprotein glucose dehydrogenase
LLQDAGMSMLRPAWWGLLAVGPLAIAAEIESLKGTTADAPGFRALVSDDRPIAPVLAPNSSEGEVRIRQFKLPSGVKVELWADEPMLANPVAFSVDERGRVFTSETYRYRTSVLDIRHYMFMLEDDLASRNITNRLETIRKWFGPAGEEALGRETEVVRLLEDLDQDGHADKSTVFADNLASPLDGIASGVLAWRGQVWLTDIPSLWRFVPAGTTSLKRMPPGGPLASTPRTSSEYRAEELLRGFGVRFSFTGHDLHGLKFGPDGRLYFSCGDRGAHVVTREGRVIEVPDEGAVFRCELDGSDLELVHRGLRNPQELAFNEYGDLFTGDNDSDQGDRERWVQVVDGADSGWRVGHQHAPLGNAGLWNLERLWVPQFAGQAAYLLPPIANIGDGPSGLVYDYGTGLDPRLRHRFLLTYFKGTSAKSGISSLAIRPRGAGYELTAHDEFLWNSLVPDVDIGPDGAVWFADWHEGWPKSNKGRIYRATFPGTVDPEVAPTQKLLAAGVGGRSEDDLLELLAHRDQRVRWEAHYELAGRLRDRRSKKGGNSAVDELERRLSRLAQTSPNEMARVHAVWSLGVAGRTTEWRPALLSLLRPERGEVAVQAARSVGWWAQHQQLHFPRHAAGEGAVKYDRFLNESLLTLVAQGNPRQRAAATEVLGRAGWRDFAPALREAVQRHPVEQDPVWRSVAATALARHPASRDLSAWTTNANRGVRLTALLALRQNASEQLRGFLDDPDPLLVLEAARAIHDTPVTAALPALANLADSSRLPSALKQFAALAATDSGAATGNSPDALRDIRADQPLPWTNAPIDQLAPLLLRVVNANYRLGTVETAKRLAALAGMSELPEGIRAEALNALSLWGTPPARDRLVGVYRPLPARDAGPARDALAGVLSTVLTPAAVKSGPASALGAVESASRLGLTNAAPILLGLVQDTNAAPELRAASLRALGELRAESVTEALKLAATDASETLRLTASRLNAQLNPADAAGQLAGKLTTGTLAEQQTAFAALGDLKSDAADAILSEWLDKLMQRGVANEVMLDLIEAAGKRSSDAVKTRVGAYQDWKLPKDHLSPYRETLAGGNAARGRKLFYENASVACTRCHQIGADGGGNAGPSLAGVASRQTREHLLESIVYPNKQVAAGYETVLVTMVNGQAYAGVVKGESDAELVVLSPEDGELRLKKSDIQSRDKGLSGMPEGMAKLLTLLELRDLVEFVGTLK